MRQKLGISLKINWLYFLFFLMRIEECEMHSIDVYISSSIWRNLKPNKLLEFGLFLGTLLVKESRNIRIYALIIWILQLKIKYYNFSRDFFPQFFKKSARKIWFFWSSKPLESNFGKHINNCELYKIFRKYFVQLTITNMFFKID